jgi:AcrR family transcriptional regulator
VNRGHVDRAHVDSTGSGSGTGKRARLGKRGEALRRAVLKAAVLEIAEAGPDDASVQSVADRAGVHETSIYRRWKTRENLFLDAIIDHVQVAVPVPDTGSLRGDLIAIATSTATFVHSPLGQALLRAGAQVSADLAEEQRAFWRSRELALAPVIGRGVARGEVAPDVNVKLVLEALVAPLQFRVLLVREEPDPAQPEQLADLVLNGVLKR